MEIGGSRRRGYRKNEFEKVITKISKFLILVSLG